MTHQSTSEQRRPRIRVAVFACIVIIAIVIDQLTKAVAQARLAGGASVPVIPGLLRFTLVHNPGASLGMGSNMTWLIALMSAVACAVLLVLVLRTQSMAWTVFLALAFAGAFGNLIDRVIHADGFLNGKVVDFLDYGWSVGNVADIFLMVAGIGIVVLILCNVPFRTRTMEDAAATTGEDAQR
ncbi:signal peptidase II [uncultured Bifidobacterium sp.]|uniref:signal peptidase II n=1 Tax=uncultured Bifidobacterium sp. TaxID=165187 RepID=UPI002586D750|nr:signal peptidase II [uncultured Bifidobacterium sp.]MEE0654583.1 signal peptidase II [Bifidobacterium criceti]